MRQKAVCNLGGTAVILQPSHGTLRGAAFFVPLQLFIWEDTMKELAKQYDPSQVEDRIYPVSYTHLTLPTKA